MAETETQSQQDGGDTKGPAWHRAFLDAFEDTGLVHKACELAGIGRATAYRHKQSHEDFALAWHDIEEKTTDAMEREAYRRGAQGMDKPIFYKGEQVATVREYSDTLLMFMLKSRKPEKYREQYDLRHSGKIDMPTGAPDLSKLSLDEARELQALLEKASRDKVSA